MEERVEEKADVVRRGEREEYDRVVVDQKDQAEDPTERKSGDHPHYFTSFLRRKSTENEREKLL